MEVGRLYRDRDLLARQNDEVAHQRDEALMCGLRNISHSFLSNLLTARPSGLNSPLSGGSLVQRPSFKPNLWSTAGVPYQR